MTYSFKQRTPELGIRMTLGASRAEILGMVLAPRDRVDRGWHRDRPLWVARADPRRLRRCQSGPCLEGCADRSGGRIAIRVKRSEPCRAAIFGCSRLSVGSAVARKKPAQSVLQPRIAALHRRRTILRPRRPGFGRGFDLEPCRRKLRPSDLRTASGAAAFFPGTRGRFRWRDRRR